MAEFIPFRALRYDTSRWVRPIPLSDLICPPYDVIDEAERQRLLARSPYNFVRIELPEDDDGDKYARAAQLLARFIAVNNVLNRDGREAFYLHEHEFEIAGRRVTRRGLFGALRLYPQSKGVVIPHELTFPKAKADRLELARHAGEHESGVR